MNKYLVYIFVLLVNSYLDEIHSQVTDSNNETVENTELFSESLPLALDLTFSVKELKKNTDDTTFVDYNLKYKDLNDSWHEIPSKLRVRGNYRLKNCYFPPLKLKIKKKIASGTIFEKDKTLKIVLPCLNQKDKNDNVIKEYLAYKMYEVLSPYHFKTRLLDITLNEAKGKKVKIHELQGFFIEDDKRVAKRANGKVFKRKSHPLNHHAISSVRNAMFQYMIGNTDYSTAYQHNCKVIFVDTSIIPVPYDFDMSGFVNTNYAVVSEILGENLGMSSVTERLYRGFIREPEVFQQVRNEFLNKKSEIIELLNAHQNYFENSLEFSVAKDYILEFFNVLQNDAKFKSNIVAKARKQ